MEPSTIASIVSASAQANVASAAAARMIKINQQAAQQLVGAIQESAQNLENIAGNLAKGVGETVDFSA
ncbi:MAG: hypothetical protein ABJO09_04235 [Hyphomicrobiales bacterium]|uniref:hypothetical protein n=1 Tax=Nisaea sp. TaxID=2024842 RepID=UPI00327A7663